MTDGENGSSRAQARSFRLAPMDGLNLGLTIGVTLLLLPVASFLTFVLPSLLATSGTPVVILFPLAGIGLLVAALLAAIPIYARPLRFELSSLGLLVIWPVRRRLVALSTITAVERLTRAELRARYGLGMRIGAGGFLGGFGWMRTATCTFHLYVSRIDVLVLVHVRGDKSWIITPESPEEFVRVAGTLREESDQR
jgi:hypothetical protein